MECSKILRVDKHCSNRYDVTMHPKTPRLRGGGIVYPPNLEMQPYNCMQPPNFQYCNIPYQCQPAYVCTPCCDAQMMPPQFGNFPAGPSQFPNLQMQQQQFQNLPLVPNCHQGQQPKETSSVVDDINKTAIELTLTPADNSPPQRVSLPPLQEPKVSTPKPREAHIPGTTWIFSVSEKLPKRDLLDYGQYVFDRIDKENLYDSDVMQEMSAAIAKSKVCNFEVPEYIFNEKDFNILAPETKEQVRQAVNLYSDNRAKLYDLLREAQELGHKVKHCDRKYMTENLLNEYKTKKGQLVLQLITTSLQSRKVDNILKITAKTNVQLSKEISRLMNFSNFENAPPPADEAQQQLRHSIIRNALEAKQLKEKLSSGKVILGRKEMEQQYVDHKKKIWALAQHANVLSNSARSNLAKKIAPAEPKTWTSQELRTPGEVQHIILNKSLLVKPIPQTPSYRKILEPQLIFEDMSSTLSSSVQSNQGKPVNLELFDQIAQAGARREEQEKQRVMENLGGFFQQRREEVKERSGQSNCDC